MWRSIANLEKVGSITAIIGVEWTTRGSVRVLSTILVSMWISLEGYYPALSRPNGRECVRSRAY